MRRPHEPVRHDRLYKICTAPPVKHRTLKCKKTATLSLLFFDACKIERYTYGRERRLLEREIIRYLADNPDILRSAKDRSLSEGRWQKTAYQAAAVCFRHKAYRAGFALLRAYAAATRGEINRLTTNE